MAYPPSIVEALQNLMTAMKFHGYNNAAMTTEDGKSIIAQTTETRPDSISFTKYCLHGVPLEQVHECSRCMLGDLRTRRKG